jgi:hypothetical protein
MANRRWPNDVIAALPCQSLALDDEFSGLMLKDLASVVLWRR